ncbi:hypothetical protein HUJ05_012926 [Dendroctonus ponderosae]|nr:hypothetical protein HUJ05_012926 [Dendroctonus ponderosae]
MAEEFELEQYAEEFGVRRISALNKCQHGSVAFSCVLWDFPVGVLLYCWDMGDYYQMHQDLDLLPDKTPVGVVSAKGQMLQAFAGGIKYAKPFSCYLRVGFNVPQPLRG